MSEIDGKKIIEYLNILGLSTKDVLTISDLKTNYRKLAKYYHPDNHDTGDAEKFKKVQEAYDYCQENLDFVNQQIKANFTINTSGFSSKEEEAFAMTALRVAASMKIFGFELNEPLTHKKLDENYYKLSVLFQTVLKDFKRLKILNDAYAFLKENFDFANILIACQFDYNIFKAAKAKADEMKREQEQREAEQRATRERAEKERREREAEERRKAEEARRKAEEERKKREAELRAKKEREKKEAQAFYKNLIEEEIGQIVLSKYSDKNKNTVRVIFDVFRKKESSIQTKFDANSTISKFKTEINKVRTIKQQKAIKKRFAISGIIAASLAVLVGIVFGIKGIVDESNRKNTYENSLLLMENGNYAKAKESFLSLGNYKESQNKIVVCDGLILLEQSIQTKSEEDVLKGIKKIVSGGEPVHVYYDSSSGHNVKRNKLSFDNSQYDEIISSQNFSLHKPSSSLNNGYTFSNWFSDKLKYEEMTKLCLDSKWLVNSYSISYHLDGGINSSGNPRSYTIETDDIYLENASKQNYTFSGWYDKQSGGNKVTCISKGTTGNIDLYARYEINHYTVNFYNWDYEKLYTTTVDHGGSVSYPYSDPTKPKDQQYSYTFKGWDKSLSNIVKNTDFVAQYSNTINQYTVTFKNYDGTVLGTDTVDYGTAASYSGDMPLKPISSDNRFSYTFNCWDISLDDIRYDCVATAQFSETNRYLANFYNEDSLLYSIMLDEGEIPVYVGENPTKDPTQQYSFAFNKWNPEPSAIHEDTDYQPVFTSTLNQYTVTFKNYDGTVLGTSTVDYGTSASYSGATPTKPKTQQYSYTFTGWDISLDSITEDVIATALYSESINQYTVTFKNYNGSILGTSTVDYGETAVYSGATPEKPRDQQYTYSFSGWNISLENVTSDRNAIALYDSTINQYTVTFKNYDGTVLGTDTVDYGTSATYSGDLPTKPDEFGCTWSFDKWDKSISNVTDNIIVTATFVGEQKNANFELSSDGKYYTLISCYDYDYEEKIFISGVHNGLPVRNIANNAFASSEYGTNWKSLKEVVFGEGIRQIGKSAFLYNTSLNKVTFPDSLTRIEEYAFNFCIVGGNVYLPKSITFIGERAFLSCHVTAFYSGADFQPSSWHSSWNIMYNGGSEKFAVYFGYTRQQVENL